MYIRRVEVPEKRVLTEAELKALPAKVRHAIEAGGLTAEEENVIRMRYGFFESDDAEIEFRGQNDDLTRTRLAQMEKEILNRMRMNSKPRPPCHEDDMGYDPANLQPQQ
ncbi:MAG: hypothetical protein HZC26_02010 [Candidatus Magasanikbacteria bacterium]|nr:hypothetical protein [Candidatus Magasanikbacteria bacterium]